MNCKEGDLAIFVGPGPRSGMVFKIVGRPQQPPIVKMQNGQDYILLNPNFWLVDPPAIAMINPGLMTQSPIPYAADEYLKPLRDSDKEDETLTWAGKPQGEKLASR